MRSCSFFIPALLFTLSISSLQANIIHVPSDSTTIQGGINGAVNGDTVMVSPGTYHEHDIDFRGKAITVMSIDPEDSAVVAATVVDANSQGRVFLFQSAEDTTSVLTGLAITHGYSGVNGGGILCTGSGPTILNNIFTSNVAEGEPPYGGGGAISCEYSNPTIISNIFTSNSARRGGAIKLARS